MNPVLDQSAPTGPPTVKLAGSNAKEGCSQKPRQCVLLVDDEASILTALRRLLRREPYDLLTADGPDEALQLLEQHAVQVVVSDYRMPKATGADLLREVQQRWPDTIRLVLSGYSEVAAIIAAINEGAIYKFLSKPWNDEELKGNIRQALEQHALAAENRRLATELSAQNDRLREANELLDQRAADAAAGLSSVHDMLEIIAAGVLTFDNGGLIVGANQRACELLSAKLFELLGMDAQAVLLAGLPQELLGVNGSDPHRSCGSIEYAGKRLQWRVSTIGSAEQPRGRVATLWEEVQ